MVWRDEWRSKGKKKRDEGNICENDKGGASFIEVGTREAVTRCQWIAQVHEESLQESEWETKSLFSKQQCFSNSSPRFISSSSLTSSTLVILAHLG